MTTYTAIAILVSLSISPINLVQPQNKEAKELERQLKSRDATVRNDAAYTLLTMDPSHSAALKVFAEFLEDEDPFIQGGTAIVLGQVAKKNPAALQILISTFANKQSKSRVPAAGALQGLGSNAKPAIPVLVQTLNDERYAICLLSAGILGAIGKDAQEAIPALEKAIRRNRGFVPIDSAAALIRIEPSHRFAKNYLIRMLATGDDEQRIRVCTRLIGVSYTEDILASLLDTLKNDKNRTVQFLVIHALPSADKPKKVASVLAEITTGRDKELRLSALDALATLGSKEGQAVTSLVKLLRDADPEVRQNAAAALGRIGAAARAAVAGLKKAANDPDPDVQRAATEALKSILETVSKASLAIGLQGFTAWKPGSETVSSNRSQMKRRQRRGGRTEEHGTGQPSAYEDALLKSRLEGSTISVGR